MFSYVNSNKKCVVIRIQDFVSSSLNNLISHIVWRTKEREAMNRNVVVWGTGNVGRPAIRSVVANQDLNLVGVIVSNPEKIGVDAGDQTLFVSLLVSN